MKKEQEQQKHDSVEALQQSDMKDQAQMLLRGLLAVWLNGLAW